MSEKTNEKKFTGENILEIKDLVVHYETDDGCVQAVNGLSFSIDIRIGLWDWWERPAPARPPPLSPF